MFPKINSSQWLKNGFFSLRKDTDQPIASSALTTSKTSSADDQEGPLEALTSEGTYEDNEVEYATELEVSDIPHDDGKPLHPN